MVPSDVPRRCERSVDSVHTRRRPTAPEKPRPPKAAKARAVKARKAERVVSHPTRKELILPSGQRIALMKSLPWRIRTKNGPVKKGRRTPRTNIGPKGERWITKGQRGPKRPQPLMIFSTRDQACVRRDLERSAPQVCP